MQRYTSGVVPDTVRHVPLDHMFNAKSKAVNDADNHAQQESKDEHDRGQQDHSDNPDDEPPENREHLEHLQEAGVIRFTP
jgi:hypothetical protein